MPITVIVRSASPDLLGGDPMAGNGSPSLTFDGDRVVLGRGAGSDVRLPDPSVSTRHATLRAFGADYTIVDEGSSNGTFIGGIKLTPHTPRLLRSGELVRIGRVWLEIEIAQKPATSDLALATRDLALALVRRAMESTGDDTVPHIVVVEGPDLGAELRLTDEGRAYVLGRSETCDLPLSDSEASREHVVVVRRGASVLLRDNDAKNGVWLGEQRLVPGRDIPWRANVLARVGVNLLGLSEPVGRVLAALEACDDEVLRDDDLPEPPRASEARRPSADGIRASVASAPPQALELASNIAARPQPEDQRQLGRRGWSTSDILVIAVALGIIGASLTALVWIVRGG